MNVELVCRLCTMENPDLRSISGDERHARLPEQLRIILQIQYDENDGLPQKVCDACIIAVQQIEDTLNEFRSNDVMLRKQLLGFEEIEVKEEELSDFECEPVSYNSLQDVNEVIEQPESLKELCQTEEWLEVNSVDADDLITQDDGSDYPPSTDVELMQRSDISEEEIPVKRKRGRPRLPEKARRKNENVSNSRVNDFRCYICKCEPLESAKALLDHLSEHSDQLPYTCKLCVQETIEIKQIRSLNIHLRMHDLPMKCTYCDRRYVTAKARDYHVQAYHLGGNAPCPSTCDVCGAVCASTLALRSHMKRHTTSFTCDICGRVFAQKSKLKRHVTWVHENTTSHECKICRKRLKTIDAYELHVRTIHEGRRDYECDICGHRFTAAAFLRMHKKQSQDGTCKPRNSWTSYYSTRITDQGTKLFCCSICPKEFPRSIAEHLRTHFPIEYECPICYVKLQNKTSFDRHRLKHSEITHSCRSCKKSFLTSRNLANHMARIHGIGEDLELGDFQLGSDDEIEFDVDDLE